MAGERGAACGEQCPQLCFDKGKQFAPDRKAAQQQKQQTDLEIEKGE